MMRTVQLLGHGKLYSLNFFQVINESFYRLRESVRKVYQLKLTYKQLDCHARDLQVGTKESLSPSPSGVVLEFFFFF